MAGQHQAIICMNAGPLLNVPLWTNFSPILIKIHTFLFKKMYLKIISDGHFSWPQYVNHLHDLGQNCDITDLFHVNILIVITLSRVCHFLPSDFTPVWDMPSLMVIVGTVVMRFHFINNIISSLYQHYTNIALRSYVLQNIVEILGFPEL